MLVLLDRDGVINEDRQSGVTCLEEFHFLPGALEAIAILSRAGFQIAVITNQSAVAKGLLTEAALEEIHQHMCARIEAAGGRIAAIYTCTDHPDRPGARRKPAPGMVLEALADFNVKAEQTPFIGDALRDLQAASAAGCPSVLVKTGKGKFTLNNGLPDGIQPIAVVEDLEQAASYVVQHFGQGVPT